MGYQGVMKRFWIFAATISSTIFTTLAIPAPSVEAGATKAATCQACHGANGNSTNPEWPSLAGLGADYIADQLNNFKTGKRASISGKRSAGNVASRERTTVCAVPGHVIMRE